jgi:hypothetical protein
MIFDQVSAVTSPIVTAVVLKKARRLLLDLYGGANAAYSLRALSSAWRDQDVVEVRRASDDTTRGFTADDIGDGTLTNWVGTGATDHGFVATWYDQSGEGNDATQSVSTAQPKIVEAGSLLVDGNGKPEVVFDGSNDFFDLSSSYTATNGAVFVVENLESTDTSQAFLGGASSGYLPLMQRDSTNTSTYIGATVTNDYLNGEEQSLATRGDYFTAICNDTKQLFSAIGVTTSISYTKLGKGGTSGWDIKGSLYEIIVYDSDQSSNRTGIEGNINTEYNIYP